MLYATRPHPATLSTSLVVASGSWGCELGEELLPAFSLAFRRYQGAQGGALVVQLLVPVFVGLGVYQQLGEPSHAALAQGLAVAPG